MLKIFLIAIRSNSQRASLAHIPLKMQKNVGTEGEIKVRVSTPYVSSATLRSVTYTSLQLETCTCTDRAEGNWSELQQAAERY